MFIFCSGVSYGETVLANVVQLVEQRKEQTNKEVTNPIKAFKCCQDYGQMERDLIHSYQENSFTPCAL